MYKVLIAEDEISVISSIRSILDWKVNEPLDVAEAHDGEAALQLMEEMQPDLLITDILMPKLTGLDLIKKVRAKHPGVDILIVSGYGEFEFAQDALRTGVADYILKPIDADYLSEMVIRMIRKKKEERRELQATSDWLIDCSETAKRWAEWLWNYERGQLELDIAPTLDRWFSGCEDRAGMTERYIMFLNMWSKQLLEKSGMDWEPHIPSAWKLDMSQVRDDLLARADQYLVRIQQARNWGYSMMVERIVEQLEADYANPELTLNMLADQHGLSPAYLSQIFKQVMGGTFLHFLTGIRMKHARRMLIESDMRLYEIGVSVGYLDYPHFSRMFKKQYGQSPAQLRKSMQIAGDG